MADNFFKFPFVYVAGQIENICFKNYWNENYNSYKNTSIQKVLKGEKGYMFAKLSHGIVKRKKTD